MKKIVTLALAGIMTLGSVLPAFAAGLSGQITASGSSALLPMVKLAAAEFQKANPGVTINVSGGGSFTGLKQVAEGAVDIGDSDVAATDDDLVDHKVAIAPFVFIANKDVTASNLTQKQAIDIFSGKITNWKEVGGEDKAITIIQRAKSSGSRATILTTVMAGSEFTDNAIVQDSNGSVKKTVSTTPGAIGYVDAPYVDESIKPLKYKGVEMNEANILNGKYPVYAYEHMYTKGQAKSPAKEFLAYIMSKSFQSKQLTQLGFIQISKEDQIDDTPAPASKALAVLIDGKAIAFPDEKPFITNGRTMVPVRFVSENMGYKVAWDAKTQKVTITASGKTVDLWINKTAVKVNTGSKTLDAAPIIKNGRTMVPLRFITEAFGSQVSWDAANNQVLIQK